MARKAGKSTRKLKTTIIWITLMTVFIAELLFNTWCRVQSVGVGYEISEATDHHKELMTSQNSLKVELASLKSPERIEKIAGKLGLVIPASGRIIVIP
jgi:cell division protein FtsL